MRWNLLWVNLKRWWSLIYSVSHYPGVFVTVLLQNSIVIAVYWLSPYCKRAHDNQFKSWRASWLTSSKSFVLLNEELSWDRMVLFFHLFSESSPLPESLGRKLWITNSASGAPDFQTFWLCRKHDTTSSRILVADNLFQDLLSPISWGNSLWMLSFFYL